MQPRTISFRRGRLAALLALSTLLCGLGATRAENTPKPARGGGAAKTAPKPESLRLAYALKPGSTYRYNITGLFNGHFPPFAQEGSPPINLRIQLTYTANVKKQDAKGIEVAFSAEEAEVVILLKEPGPDGKSNPDDEAPLPLPLSQVQTALNVTALMRPDGSIASIVGGDDKSVKIDLGFELRKLFLLLMPVTFPDKAVKVNEEWTYSDGFLGSKPGKVAYKGRLLNIQAAAKNLSVGIDQNAEALIEDSRDKEGKPTDKPADAVDTTRGKVTISGSMTFVAPAKATDNRHSGLLSIGRMTMNAQLTRKRTLPDPERPDDPLESKIDVKARLFVKADKANGQTPPDTKAQENSGDTTGKDKKP